MSIEQAKAFRDKLNADASLQDELRAAASNSEEFTVADVGRRHGFDFSAEDAKTVIDGADGELSEFELEMVQAAVVMKASGDSY